MKYTNKVVVLDEDIYKSLLQQSKTENQTVSRLTSLEKDLQQILADKTGSEDEKFLKYQNTFGNYKRMLEDARTPTKLVVESALGPVEELNLDGELQQEVSVKVPKKTKIVKKGKQKSKSQSKTFRVNIWKRKNF